MKRKVFNFLLALLVVSNVWAENKVPVVFVPEAELIQVRNGETAGYAFTSPDGFQTGVTEYTAQIGIETDSIILAIKLKRSPETPWQIGTDIFVVPLPKFTVKVNNVQGLSDPLVPRGFRGDKSGTKRDTLDINHYDINGDGVSFLDSVYISSDDSIRFPYNVTGDETFKFFYVLNTKGLADVQGSLTIDFTGVETYYQVVTNYNETYSVKLTKANEIAKIATLKQLHLSKKQEDVSVWDIDKHDDLLTNFSPTNFQLNKVEDNFTDSLTLFAEATISTSKIKVKVNNSDANVIEKNQNGVHKTFYLPKTGGDVVITVTSTDSSVINEYKFSYENTLQIPIDSIYKGISRFDSAQTYLQDLFLYNDTDTFKLYSNVHNKQFKDVGGYYWRPYSTTKVELENDSNTYVVAIPNPSDTKLKLGYVLHPTRAYAFTSQEYKVAVDKTTGESEIYWDVKLVNKNGSTITIDTVGSEPHKDGYGGGYAIHRIYLKSNNNYLTNLAFRFDSITAETHYVNNFNKDSLNYGTFDLPQNLKVLYVYAPEEVKKSDKKLKVFFNNIGLDSVNKIGGVSYPDWYKTTATNLKVSEFIALQSKYVKVSSESEAGDFKNYFIEFKRPAKLELVSVTITVKGNKYEEYTTSEKITKLLNEGCILPSTFSPEDGDEFEVNAVDAESTTAPYKVVTVSKKTFNEGDDYIEQITLKDIEGNIARFPIKLITPKAITTLSYLFTDPSGLKPSFNSDITEYELIVPDETSKVRLIADATDPYATISGQGHFDFSGDSLTYKLEVLASNQKDKKTYSILVKTESFEEEGGQTGISKISNSSYVSYNNNTLTVSNSSIERVYVLSTLGQLITTFDKSSGSISIPFNQKGIFILNGSSGWVSKILVK